MVRITKYKRRRGTAAVEAALMMPLIMLMTFALVKYGWLYVKVQQINNAARHGARVAARADSNVGTIDAEIDALMAKVWSGSPPDNAYSVAFNPDPDPDPDEGPWPTGTIVTVTITVPYRNTPLDIISMPLVPVPGSIAGTASMAREG